MGRGQEGVPPVDRAEGEDRLPPLAHLEETTAGGSTPGLVAGRKSSEKEIVQKAELGCTVGGTTVRNCQLLLEIFIHGGMMWDTGVSC